LIEFKLSLNLVYLEKYMIYDFFALLSTDDQNNKAYVFVYS